MFNIDVLTGDPSENPSDERIGLTVLEVFNSFFQKSQNVAVYDFMFITAILSIFFMKIRVQHCLSKEMREFEREG
ncbi:MAG TPA: hypothetical protein VK517_02220 [Cyclobacteriaceae bacterium]|nr:hypothetical protein [Cyclobacteriaceae bacterium]